jgi:CheY-like chemotaxis protein
VRFVFSLLARKKWPTFTSDEIRKRARLLVIDDGEFPYQGLFKRDGYAIDKWNDVENLSILERGAFDIILLDIHGVGSKESKEQGFGVLKHLRAATPAQIVIAYSNSDWSLKYQEFFDLADAKLDKRSDYVDFKKVVDDQLRRRFSLEFYVERALQTVGTRAPDHQKLRKLVTKAILSRNPRPLEKYLTSTLDTKDITDIVLRILQVAIGIASLATV